MYTTVRVSVISAEFDKFKRRIVKFWRFGKDDVNTSMETSPFGIDSNPIKDIAAIYAETAKIGETVLIGYINKDQLAAIGETRLFSKDAAGLVKAYVWAKNDGVLLLNGDANFAVKFNELKTGFDQLKVDLNDLITKYNTHGHAALNAPTTLVDIASTASIDSAKNDNIKTS